MNWYLAKIVFSISSDNTVHKPQFDEQLRLIAARSEEEAFIKARAVGIKEEDSFLNDKRNKVRWEFINVAEIVRVNALEDGSELYSHIHETDEATAYVKAIHDKATFIRTHTNL